MKKYKMQNCNRVGGPCVHPATLHLSMVCESVFNKWGERVTDVVADDEVGDVVELGRFAIENDQSCAIALGHQGESRRRPYHQRGTDREKQIALQRKFLS